MKYKSLGYSVNLPSGYNIVRKLSKDKIFTSLQIMFDSQNIKEDKLKEIKKIVSVYENIFVHSTYKINIGSDFVIENLGNSDNSENSGIFYNLSFELLLKEIKYSYSIGAKGIVVHMGRNTQNRYSNDTIYNNMVIFTLQLFSSKIIKKDFSIIFETSAGQGGEMCYELIDFVNFILSFKNYPFYQNISVCIDTCHIYQAGYDLNNSKVIKKLHHLFQQIQDKISLIHLNDSYNQVGKRIDRHQTIGEGFIKTKNLVKFIEPYKNIPMIFETPDLFKSLKNLLA